MLNIEKWDFSHFIKQKSIGKGDHGEVFIVENSQTREIYQAKIYYENVIDSDRSSLFQKLSTFLNLNHPSISPIIGYSIITDSNSSESHLITYSNYYKSTLSQYINDKNTFHNLDIIYKIASGMSYLHSQDIIHSNLKPTNILLDDQFNPYITDYITDKKKEGPEIAGTSIYTAPEIWAGNDYTESTDVYSFAMIMYEIMTRKKPFQGMNPFEFISVVYMGDRPELNSSIPQLYNCLINKCWSADPFQRPSFDKIVNCLDKKDQSIIDPLFSPPKSNLKPKKTKKTKKRSNSKIKRKENPSILSSKSDEDVAEPLIKKPNLSKPKIKLVSDSESNSSQKSEEEELPKPKPKPRPKPKTIITSEIESDSSQKSEEEELPIKKSKKIPPKKSNKIPPKKSNKILPKFKSYSRQKSEEEAKLHPVKRKQASKIEPDSSQKSEEEAELHLAKGKRTSKIESDLNQKEKESNSYSQSIEKDDDSCDNKHIIDDLKNKTIDLDLFVKHQKIGEGGFGSVYKITRKENVSEEYVAKISKKSIENLLSINDIDAISLRHEIDIQSRLNHPLILKFIGYSSIDFKNQPRPVIISEYVINGSLDNILVNESKSLASSEWTDTKKLINIYGIASAMMYLHMNNILHLDLKAENILVDSNFYPKLSDFGLSKDLSQKERRLNINNSCVFKGTPTRIAPEIWTGSEYSKQVDVYAFGLTVFEIMTNEKPFSDVNNVFQIMLEVSMKGHRPVFKYEIPRSYKKLIDNCWSQNPNDRPSFENIVDSLKNDSGFITDTVDEDEFLKFVDLIDQLTNEIHSPQTIMSKDIICDKNIIERKCNLNSLMSLNSSNKKNAEINKGIKIVENDNKDDSGQNVDDKSIHEIEDNSNSMD